MQVSYIMGDHAMSAHFYEDQWMVQIIDVVTGESYNMVMSSDKFNAVMALAFMGDELQDSSVRELAESVFVGVDDMFRLIP